MKNRRSFIVEATGRIPVGARQSVRADFLEGRDAAERGDTQKQNWFAGRLGRFARQHSYQAVGGFCFAALNAHYAMRHGSGVVAAEAVYDGLYGCVNSMVAYTHAYLAQAVRATPPVALTPAEASPTSVTPAYNRTATKLEAFSVMGGQLAFMATVAAPSLINAIPNVANLAYHAYSVL
ncbi:MAG TPA: hypothetical protein VLF71_03855 [Candidatus Saccharimonadales bacterium]|nr:hypothetical protein [Candidatus Saccharimonadales bacterium]